MKILVIDACETNRARTAEALRELTNVWIHDSVGTIDDALGCDRRWWDIIWRGRTSLKSTG